MKKILPWLTAFAILVVVFGTIYTVAQQSQRDSANNPQIQMSQDAASALDTGAIPLALTNEHIDMSKSLAPFTIIYDKHGNVVNGSGYIHGEVPKAPLGMLQASNNKNYNAVSWQPAKDVRIASVTVSAKDYYVLSGRSLEEIEKNATKSFQLSLIGGLASTILLIIAFAIHEFIRKY